MIIIALMLPFIQVGCLLPTRGGWGATSTDQRSHSFHRRQPDLWIGRRDLSWTSRRCQVEDSQQKKQVWQGPPAHEVPVWISCRESESNGEGPDCRRHEGHRPTRACFHTHTLPQWTQQDCKEPYSVGKEFIEYFNHWHDQGGKKQLCLWGRYLFHKQKRLSNL